jgi:hypothetical protein
MVELWWHQTVHYEGVVPVAPGESLEQAIARLTPAQLAAMEYHRSYPVVGHRGQEEKQ